MAKLEVFDNLLDVPKTTILLYLTHAKWVNLYQDKMKKMEEEPEEPEGYSEVYDKFMNHRESLQKVIKSI